MTNNARCVSPSFIVSDVAATYCVKYRYNARFALTAVVAVISIAARNAAFMLKNGVVPAERITSAA